MLLGGNAGQRLEPMGKVGRAVLDRPVLHCAGNDVSDAGVQILAHSYCVEQRFVDLFGKPLSHHVLAEYLRGEYIGDSCLGFHIFFLFQD